MKTRKEKKKNWIVIIIALLVITPLLARKIFNFAEALIIENKAARNARGIVTRKGHIQFDEKFHSYLNEDGFPIEMRAGEEEWRVYYRITDFGEIDAAVKSNLLKMEEERLVKNKLRFTIVNKDQYDYIQEGDELLISWHWLGSNKIQIISAGKAVAFHKNN